MPRTNYCLIRCQYNCREVIVDDNRLVPTSDSIDMQALDGTLCEIKMTGGNTIKGVS